MKTWGRNAMLLACFVTVMPAKAQSGRASNIYGMAFDHTNSQVWVVGEIADSKGRFLIDTGAASTIVDAEFARGASLRPLGGEVTLPFVFYPRARGKKVVLENLMIGDFRIPRQAAVIADLSPVSSQVGVNVDAIIGMDMLCKLETLEIDYSALELVMISAGREEQGNCPSISPVVQVTVSGRPSRLLVDTGSKFGITLFAETGDMVRSPVTLAEFGSADYQAHFVRRPEGTAEIDGLIGSGILMFLRVQFAERRTQILLRKSNPN